MQLGSLSLIYKKAMAAAAASGGVEWVEEDGKGLSSTWKSNLEASGALGILISIEEEMEEIDRECNSANRRALQEARTVVAEGDETIHNARECCEKSLCALQLRQHDKALMSLQ